MRELLHAGLGVRSEAFSSEVEIGSRQENAPKQKARAPALILSKPERR
jgi:hypothetical protein